MWFFSPYIIERATTETQYHSSPPPFSALVCLIHSQNEAEDQNEAENEDEYQNEAEEWHWRGS